MATYQLPDERTVSDSMAFTLDGIQYPNNWLLFSSEAERTARGITGPLAAPADYDQRFYWGPNNPKDHGQLQNEYIGHVKRNVASLLSDTDWYLTRQAETGASAPAAVLAYRTALRTASNDKQASIRATTAVAGLVAYITGADYPAWPSNAALNPDAQSPNYRLFWDALLASTVYGSIRTQSMASLPMNTLATEFIALIGDAKAGRLNAAAIQASMSAVFATGTFTEADAEEFTAALAAGYLDGIYTLGAE
jgi:hypothetical protein